MPHAFWFAWKSHNDTDRPTQKNFASFNAANAMEAANINSVNREWRKRTFKVLNDTRRITVSHINTRCSNSSGDDDENDAEGSLANKCHTILRYPCSFLVPNDFFLAVFSRLWLAWNFIQLTLDLFAMMNTADTWCAHLWFCFRKVVPFLWLGFAPIFWQMKTSNLSTDRWICINWNLNEFEQCPTKLNTLCDVVKNRNLSMCISFFLHLHRTFNFGSLSW